MIKNHKLFSFFLRKNKSLLCSLKQYFKILEVFRNTFFSYLKIYQLNIIKKIKKGYKKELVKDIKVFLKKKKKKSDNIVMNVTKISQKMKNKSFLSIEKNIIE